MSADLPTGQPSLIDLLNPQRRAAMLTVFGEKYASKFEFPVSFLDGKLCSPAAIRLFNREFQYISRVTSYEYAYRSWEGFNQEVLDRYSEIVSRKLGQITTIVDSWTRRIAKVMESNGASMDSTFYPHALEMPIPIISAQAGSYFRLLQSLDQVILLAGAANLTGVLDSKQRAEAERLCRNAVRAFGNVLRNEVVKVYQEATRVVNGQRSAGQIDTKQAQAVEDQGQDLEALNKAIESGGPSSGSSEAISDMAAASNAVAAVEGISTEAKPRVRRVAAPKSEASAA